MANYEHTLLALRLGCPGADCPDEREAIAIDVESLRAEVAKLRKERNQWEDCAALYMADRDRLLIALREFMDVCAYAERDVLKAWISRAYNMGRAALAAGQHYQPTTTNAHAALTATEAAK